MEETFAATPEIADMIHYTGYVTDGAAPPPAKRAGILVSLGGGAVGDELALACLAVVDRFPEHPMHVLTGPYTSDDSRRHFTDLAQQRPNVTIGGFSAHADRDQLLAWHRATAARQTVLVHGDEEAMQVFAAKLPQSTTVMPARGEELAL